MHRERYHHFLWDVPWAIIPHAKQFMDESPSYSYRGLMLTAVILMGVGWVGISILMRNTLPTLGPRWLLFFLWTAAVTGTSLPFLWLLNRRFRSKNPAPPKVLLREGLFIGLFAATCLWLQLNRTLSLTLALLLALGLFAIAWLLRYVERSTWRPGE
ncbi:MAG: hypothetical protein GTO18_05885 [Anaerolineales bacterium]|nr:hypothetical protein [Anaerolineales bacterium]